MKKKVIGILVCMMLMAVIPAAAGLNVNTEPDTGTTGLVKERIIMRGIILNPHTTRGGDFAFYGLRVHYMSVGPQGIKSGVVHLQRITLAASPNGLITNGFLLITFRGRIDDII